jgi:hypothetical protein
METLDTTNNNSISSGASLDMDVHGLPQTKHLRSNQRNGEFDEYHGRSSSGDSCNSFGESFMMEESFAFGESFTGYENGYNNTNGRYHPEESLPTRLPVDISSILIIEEDCEDSHLIEMGDGQEITTENRTGIESLTVIPAASFTVPT